MAKKYLKLRGRMAEQDVDQQELSRALKLSNSAVSTRLAAKYPWTVEQVYTICDLLEIDYDEIPTYFPRGGVAQSAAARLRAV